MRFILFFLLFTACLLSKDIQDVIVRDTNGGIINFDAFGRLENAIPYTLGDYIFKYDLLPEDWQASTVGTGAVTHLTDTRCARLSTPAAIDSVKFSSNLYHRYQAGKAGKAVLSLVAGEPETGVIKRWGYYDDNNGLFFQLNGLDFGVCVRSSSSGSAVDNCVTGTFNGLRYEKLEILDNIDFSKGNIYEIDFQWLGTGVVKFKIANSEGQNFVIHEFKHPNTLPSAYMQTAALPLRVEQVASAGVTPSTSLGLICCSIVSSGGEDPPESFFGWGTEDPQSYATTTADEEEVVAFRIKDLYKGFDNRVVVLPTRLALQGREAPSIIRVYVNPTISGGSWLDVDSQSGVEYNTGVTSFSGGRKLQPYHLYADTQGGPQSSPVFGTNTVGFTKFSLKKHAFSGADSILFTIQRDGGTNAEASISVQWGEIK